MKPITAYILYWTLASVGSLALHGQIDPYNSGGILAPEQAAYDISFYDLTISISPVDSSIAGTVEIKATAVVPTDRIAIDLDPLLSINQVGLEGGAILPVSRFGGRVFLGLPRVFQPGEALNFSVQYGGKPRVAPRPPWDGGFTWKYTADGSPWIATTCQTIGADVWWPCKDHVSDKPDSMGIHVRVPDPLVVASNGRLRSVEAHEDGTSTYHWFSSNPISVYNVALNIAPYEVISDTIPSIAGDRYPVVFYVLPEDLEKGRKLFPEIIEHLNFYESLLGPYPFRADKYGVAQTPHLGMEHQTIIAYGANFDNGSMTRGMDWGFDALHHHELGHEWWGNLVTNSDWRDMWIHEGFCTYMQGLYVEQFEGPLGMKKFMARSRNFANVRPIAPRAFTSSQHIYRAPIYAKGAWVLHSLRFLVGDSTFFPLLRRMAYPSPSWEQTTDGSQVRFVSTDEFATLAEHLSGEKLGWFFEVYTRQPQLPRLQVERTDEQTRLYWEVPDDLPFQMPLEVEVAGKRMLLPMKDKEAILSVRRDVEIKVDPEYRILFERE